MSGADTPSKTAYAQFSMWYNEETEHIHLAIAGSDFFVTTVSDKDGSKRCHKNLYKKLSRYLCEQGVMEPKQKSNE